MIKLSAAEMMDAAGQGDLDRIRKLIALGAKPKHFATKANNAVTEAAFGNGGGYKKPKEHRLQLVQELVSAGCPVEGNALFGPIDLDEIDLVRFLIKHGADVNVVRPKQFGFKIRKGDTPLTFAIQRKKQGMMHELIAAGADVNQSVTLSMGFGLTVVLPPLCAAVISDCFEAVQVLVESGAILGKTTSDGRTALHIAAANNSLAIAQFLLKAGDDPNRPDNEGRTPLAIARNEELNDMVQLLAANNATVPAEFEKQELFIAAASGGDLVAVRNFLEMGIVDLNGKTKFAIKEPTALHLAAERGHFEIVRELLNRGADIEAGDHIGCSPLCYATEAGQVAVVELLLKAGSNTEVPIKQAYEGYVTPLVVAAEHGHFEIVEMLLRAGANVAHQSRTGKTALTAAAGTRETKLIAILIDAVADQQNSRRLLNNALWQATLLGNCEGMQLLLNAGADPKVTGEFGGVHVSALEVAKQLNFGAKLKLLRAAGA